MLLKCKTTYFSIRWTTVQYKLGWLRQQTSTYPVMWPFPLFAALRDHNPPTLQTHRQTDTDRQTDRQRDTTHFFTQSLSSFHHTRPYHHNLFAAVPRLCHLELALSLSLAASLGTLYLVSHSSHSIHIVLS